MIHLLEQTSSQLRDWFAERGLPAYRAGQVRKWLFQNTAGSFEEMTDLPAELRRQLAEEFQVWSTRVRAHRKAADGTEKLLLELSDAERIECVLLRDDKQHCTVCLSTQVGCAMGCMFCATGLDGFVRNLTPVRSWSRCYSFSGCSKGRKRKRGQFGAQKKGHSPIFAASTGIRSALVRLPRKSGQSQP